MLTILVKEEELNQFKVVDEDEPTGISYGESICLMEAILEALDLFDYEEDVAVNYRCNRCIKCPFDLGSH